MRRPLIVMLLSVLLTGQAGCINIFGIGGIAREAMQRCAVESEPAGALIRVNGQRVGTAPCEIGRPFGDGGREKFQFSASLTGYHTEVREFKQFPTYVLFQLRATAATSQPAALLECNLETLPAPARLRSVAVLDFQASGDGDDSHDIGITLADFCRETVQDSRRMILVDRENMRALLSEEDFAATYRCDDTRCLVDFGRKLCAELIIHGRTTQIADTRILTLKLVDVASAKIVALRNVRTPGSCEELLDLIGPATCRLLHDALLGSDLPDLPRTDIEP